MTPLQLELTAAAAGMPRAAFDQLVSMGTAHSAKVGTGFAPGMGGREYARWLARAWGAATIGTANVTLSRSFWEPEGPDRRLLLGVFDAAGALIDIAAIASHRRDVWALRTGQGWALGLDVLEDAHRSILALDNRQGAAPSAKVGTGFAPRRGGRKRITLRIYASPFDWLAAQGDGLCVLDWTAAAIGELRALGPRVTIEADPGAGERLKALLARGDLPRVREARGNWSEAA